MSVDFQLRRMPSFAELKKDSNIEISHSADFSTNLLTYRGASLGLYEDTFEDDASATVLRYVGGDDASVKEVLWYLWETYGTLWFADCSHDITELIDEADRYSAALYDSVSDEFFSRCMLESMNTSDPRRQKLEAFHSASAEALEAKDQPR